MEALCLKMATGHEIVCELIKRESDDDMGMNILTVKNPITFIPNPQADANQPGGLIPVPWMPTADQNKVFINYNQVMAESTPSENIMSFYNETFGSGIKIAKTMPPNASSTGIPNGPPNLKPV